MPTFGATWLAEFAGLDCAGAGRVEYFGYFREFLERHENCQGGANWNNSVEIQGEHANEITKPKERRRDFVFAFSFFWRKHEYFSSTGRECWTGRIGSDRAGMGYWNCGGGDAICSMHATVSLQPMSKQGVLLNRRLPSEGSSI